MRENQQFLGFINAYSGTEKTYTFNILLSKVLQMNKKIISCAYSGISDILLLDETTIYSHFKPPFDPEEGSTLNISKRRKKAK